jgi:tyrosine-protein kinase Etk/Wzc
MLTDASLPEIREPEDSTATAPKNRPVKGTTEISLLDLLVVLAERKKTILWITGCFAVSAIIISLFLPKRYTATATILPPQQNSSSGSLALASQLGSLGGMAALAGTGLGIKNPNDMYVAMLKSRTVEEAMIQRFGLMQEYHERYLSNTREALESRTKLDGSGKDGLIYISIEAKDPNRAAELANGYVDQFRKLSEGIAITEASQRRRFFEQQLEQAKDNLAQAEESMKQTEQTTGMIQLNGQASALIQSAVSLRAQITTKEVEIQSLRTFATDQNAQLFQAEKELESLQTQLAKLGGAGDGSDAGMLPTKGRVTTAGLEFLRKEREVKYRETIFELLARQFELAKLDEAKQGALIQVVDAAAPPDHRSSPKRTIIVIFATLAGFFVGIFVALLQAVFQTMKSDPQTLPKISALYEALSFRRPRISRA